MSKAAAYRLDGPFSRTSHHQALDSPMAMWLGTMSTIWPIPRRREGLGQALVAGLAAQLDVEPGVVDHVVAVGAPRRRLEDRRQVDVADAEVGQVVDDLGGVVEREPGVHLEAVRGQRR